jgi:two-component system, oxyanion-binding sensor
MIRLTAGFLPLVDAALLIVCREMGFAENNNLDLTLVKETSWANMRDRLSVGQFDCAHMLAPLPIAQNLGLSPLREKLIVPFALGIGGNAITVSNTVFADMQAHVRGTMTSVAEAGRALKDMISTRRSSSQRPLVFAVVHAYSSHSYELRYWLSACGINPDIDVEITIVPPGLMADALAAGHIDGFCVGEPWNSVAASKGAGHIIATKAAIWQSSPEKVLAFRETWAMQNVETVQHLLVAMHQAALWASKAGNRDALAQLLSQPHYVGVDARLILQSLGGTVRPDMQQPDFLLFHERAANFPWQSHALWFYAQMVRWGQVAHSTANTSVARLTYRPDIYRRALQQQGAALPGASSKVEGDLREPTYLPASGGSLRMGPDGFFDGVKFDPDDIDGYLAQYKVFAALHKN